MRTIDRCLSLCAAALVLPTRIEAGRTLSASIPAVGLATVYGQ